MPPWSVRMWPPCRFEDLGPVLCAALDGLRLPSFPQARGQGPAGQGPGPGGWPGRAGLARAAGQHVASISANLAHPLLHRRARCSTRPFLSNSPLPGSLLPAAPCQCYALFAALPPWVLHTPLPIHSPALYSLPPCCPQHRVSIKYATEHRCGVVVRGPGLADQIGGTDPLKDNLPLLVSERFDAVLGILAETLCCRKAV